MGIPFSQATSRDAHVGPAVWLTGIMGARGFESHFPDMNHPQFKYISNIYIYIFDRDCFRDIWEDTILSMVVFYISMIY